MNKELVVFQNDFDVMERQSSALQASGYFKDFSGNKITPSQALVKVMAGAELGIAPFAAMSGIHIIQGKPEIGAGLLAAMVKSDPRYDYRVKQADNTACILEWFEAGAKVGESSFTWAEAGKVTQYNGKTKKWEPLTSKNTWQSYASDMLFARAMSRGKRRFAPDAGNYSGVVYASGEISGNENVIEGEVIKADPRAEYLEPLEYEAAQVETFDTDLNPVNVDTATGEIVEPITYGERPTAANMPKMPTEKQHKRFHAIGASAYGDKWNAKRAAMVKHLKLTTSKDLTLAQMDTLIEGIEAKANGN